jgi:hypothetical protein
MELLWRCGSATEAKLLELFTETFGSEHEVFDINNK